MTTECGCTGLIAEILNEIEEKEFDGTTGKNMATFLTKISSKDPKALIPVIDDITDFFTKDVSPIISHQFFHIVFSS